MSDAIVIGAGPAGLMAADALASAGMHVTMIEGKPSPARKLLMAGKSGLNLTFDQPFQDFVAKYGEASEWLRPMLGTFSNRDVQAWAQGLGQEVFTGSSGRVFPRSMKASPLLRAWLERLRGLGVTMKTRWHWRGWEGSDIVFDTPQGRQVLSNDRVVLALGGASWPRLGSDGGWATILEEQGIEVAPFQPANMGFDIRWSDHMARFFGMPAKTCCLTAGGVSRRGEFVLTRNGIEGGAVYSLSRILREGAALTLDMMPDRSVSEVAERLARDRGKASLANHLRKSLRLDPLRIALLQEFARPLPVEPAKLAGLIKALPVPLVGPRPISEAISTAGGVCRSEFDENLMLTKLPGVFCAGEMLDWEAPTGGYLLTACLASGLWAGRHAAGFSCN